MGKKGELHPDPADPPRIRANKSAGAAFMRMIVRPLLVQSGAKVGKCAYALFIIQIEKRWKRMLIVLLSRKRVVTQMSGKQTITSSENIRPFATQKVSGHEMMMEMAFGKFIRTLSKVCGRMSAIFYALSRAFKKKYFCGYVAMAEFRRNLKRISLAFITAIVASH